MSGYFGYKMSNNAVAAYANGEKPLSKWKKSEIINLISKIENLPFPIQMLKKMPAKAVKDTFLYCSSWHHTSSYYNKTDFYSFDEDAVFRLTEEKIKNIIEEAKNIKKEDVVEEKWKCVFLEWSGSRKHPKARKVVEEGVIKGNWFYRSNGTKKNIFANGFQMITKLE